MALIKVAVDMTLCTYCQQVAFEDLFAGWICDIRAMGFGGGASKAVRGF